MWQEGVPSIAMVTNIKEDGKIKCQQYSTESGHQKYGPFTVATTENKEFADYVIRVFEVSVSFSGQLMLRILWDTVGYCGCGTRMTCLHFVVLFSDMTAIYVFTKSVFTFLGYICKLF